MANFVTICFKPCEPIPVEGYQVHYRPAGSNDDLRVWPVNFSHSPAQLLVNVDPDGTEYEATSTATAATACWASASPG
jgi:hypothetical protein